MIGKEIYNWSYDNMSIVCSTRKQADDTYDDIYYELDTIGEPIRNYKCTKKDFSELLDVVYETDWDVWYGIYRNENKRVYEYGGTIIKTSSNEYCSMIMFRGSQDEVQPITDLMYNGCNIHSHPATYIFNSNMISTLNYPSIDDFELSIGSLSLLVTMRGVIIYGVPNNVKNINDTSQLITKFVSWYDLGYDPYPVLYTHDNECKFAIDCTKTCDCSYSRRINTTYEEFMHVYDAYGYYRYDKLAAKITDDEYASDYYDCTTLKQLNFDD